jgi:hypothetical protein
MIKKSASEVFVTDLMPAAARDMQAADRVSRS